MASLFLAIHDDEAERVHRVGLLAECNSVITEGKTAQHELERQITTHCDVLDLADARAGTLAHAKPAGGGGMNCCCCC